MKLSRIAAFFLALGLAFALLERPARAEPGDELTISVLTFGPGDHPFFKFGHNAIWVHDANNPFRGDRVYNFGTFGFDSPWLLVDFFKGKLKYWLSVQSMRGTVEAYRRENRTIDAQELNLTPAQRRQLADALALNARPENAYYKYDYYLDNCSTRVRDAIDKVIGGRIHAATQAPAEYTWREHTMRLTADDLPVYLGLYVAMGDFIDKPVHQWEEMFLPSKVEEHLRHVTVIGPNGDEQPLVKHESQILAAPGRGPLRSAPPHWTIGMFLVGCLIGGVFAGLGKLGAEKPVARATLGAILSVIGLVLGFLAWLFLAFWFLTDHAVAYHNENILQTGPWSIVLVGAGIGLARGKVKSIKTAFTIARIAAIASAVGLVLKVLPWFDQKNAQIIALMLPIWAGAAGGTWFLWKKAEVALRAVEKPQAEKKSETAEAAA